MPVATNVDARRDAQRRSFWPDDDMAGACANELIAAGASVLFDRLSWTNGAAQKRSAVNAVTPNGLSNE